MKLPDDLVLVGYVSGAYGINGWVRIHPYSSDADALLSAKTWWLDKPELQDVEMLQSKVHGGDVVAQLMGVSSRNGAEALKGAAVQVRRSHFPALSDDEFYWVDLIGLDVENLRGEHLGAVTDLLDYGAHPILRVLPPAVSPETVVVEGASVDASAAVAGAPGDADDAGNADETVAGPGAAGKRKDAAANVAAASAEILIPFVDQFVKTVDQGGRRIVVDWERDY
jgi:16S rRNA processing protein RimM